jgi:hypothetical protein
VGRPPPDQAPELTSPAPAHRDLQPFWLRGSGAVALAVSARGAAERPVRWAAGGERSRTSSNPTGSGHATPRLGRMFTLRSWSMSVPFSLCGSLSRRRWMWVPARAFRLAPSAPLQTARSASILLPRCSARRFGVEGHPTSGALRKSSRSGKHPSIIPRSSSLTAASSRHGSACHASSSCSTSRLRVVRSRQSSRRSAPSPRSSPCFVPASRDWFRKKVRTSVSAGPCGWSDPLAPRTSAPPPVGALA